MPIPDPRKSGQAIIFLMVVLVIGILAVVWNFDLHRVVSSKLRMRNAGDAAAMAGARWQGYTLNMIGDLNLIQAILMADAEEEQIINDDGETEWVVTIPPEVYDLQELRNRLELIGPLGAFAVAQQTAFNNGALPDPELTENLIWLAEEMRDEIGATSFPDAFEEYADLMEDLAVRGVAVSSYGLNRLRHPLMQEQFYWAISQSMADWWCPMYRYRYWLENYEDFESWPSMAEEFRHRLVFDLQLDEYFPTDPVLPDSALVDPDDFYEELEFYRNDTVPDAAFGEFFEDGLAWHVYRSDSRGTGWNARWPRPAEYDDEVTARNMNRLLAIRERVKPQYNYLGAVAGISIEAPVSRGILSSTGNETVDLAYKAKAKPFGFLNVEDGLVPPNYFGFVFPSFRNVRLVHSDIGAKALSGEFYNHITKHLRPYLEGGPDALNPDCYYCGLLKAWEELDRREGLNWLERAYNDDADNPCEPNDESDVDPIWGEAGGGATGGS